MSHVATVKVAIKDLGAMRAACEALGLELREGQTTYAAYKTGRCAHAIGIKGQKATGAYQEGGVELGLVAKGGAYELTYDLFGAERLAGIVGYRCEKLMTAYTGQVTRKTLLAQGYMPQGTKTLADGTVQLVFSRG